MEIGIQIVEKSMARQGCRGWPCGVRPLWWWLGQGERGAVGAAGDGRVEYGLCGGGLGQGERWAAKDGHVEYGLDGWLGRGEHWQAGLPRMAVWSTTSVVVGLVEASAGQERMPRAVAAVCSTASVVWARRAQGLLVHRWPLDAWGCWRTCLRASLGMIMHRWAWSRRVRGSLGCRVRLCGVRPLWWWAQARRARAGRAAEVGRVEYSLCGGLGGSECGAVWAAEDSYLEYDLCAGLGLGKHWAVGAAEVIHVKYGLCGGGLLIKLTPWLNQCKVLPDRETRFLPLWSGLHTDLCSLLRN